MIRDHDLRQAMTFKTLVPQWAPNRLQTDYSRVAIIPAFRFLLSYSKIVLHSEHDWLYWDIVEYLFSRHVTSFSTLRQFDLFNNDNNNNNNSNNDDNNNIINIEKKNYCIQTPSKIFQELLKSYLSPCLAEL